jgi:hypothetical protein
MTQETLAGGSEFGAVSTALEQPGAQFVFQGLNARADGGLGDMQPAGGGDKVAGSRHGKECSGEFDIHVWLQSLTFNIDLIDIK